MEGHSWRRDEGDVEAHLHSEEPLASPAATQRRKRGPPALEKVAEDGMEGDSDIEGGEGEGGGGGEGESSSESSDSGSSNTSTTSTGSSSLSSIATDSAGHLRLWETDEYGKFITVHCNTNEARFYLNRFSRGSVGRCVLFRGRWITPNEFQAISGRQSSKDWKRSIRLRGRCLKEFIVQGLFREHPKTCTCKVCLREDGWGDAALLRQEGELALAAKRRRLSQAADGGTLSALPPQPTPEGDVKPRKRRGRPPKRQKVWSPSGEMAHDASSNDEEQKPEEQRGLGAVEQEGEQEGEVEEAVVGEDRAEKEELEDDIEITPGFAHRGSRPPQRAVVHRKHVGHRTELGTFARRPIEWDCEEVAEFLAMHGFPELSATFQQSEISGETLFMLQEHHLIDRFHMKLGPCLKLLDTISRLKHPPL